MTWRPASPFVDVEVEGGVLVHFVSRRELHHHQGCPCRSAHPGMTGGTQSIDASFVVIVCELPPVESPACTDPNRGSRARFHRQPGRHEKFCRYLRRSGQSESSHYRSHTAAPTKSA